MRTTFIDVQEREFLDKLYALVSREGGHANMAPQESARILRQQALTEVHFATPSPRNVARASTRP